MKTQRGFGILAAVGVVGGVVALGGLGYAVKKTSDKIAGVGELAVKAVDTRMGEMVRAIPGERYNQLIDDLYGDDEDKKARAQAFLTRLAGLDFNSTFQVSAGFAFDETPPLRAQLFPSTSSSADAVALYLNDQENLVPVRSTIVAAPSAMERREAISASTKYLLDNHQRLKSQIIDCDDPNPRNPYMDGSINMRRLCTTPEFKKQADKSKAAYEKMFTDLVDAQLAAYHQGNIPTPLPADSLTVAWNQLRDQYVILAVVEADLVRHRKDKCISDGQLDLPGKGCIKIWVHEKGDSKKVAYEGGVFNVSVLDFYRNPPIRNATPDGSAVRYVARRADPSKMFDVDALAAYRQMQNLRKQQQDAVAGAAAERN